METIFHNMKHSSSGQFHNLKLHYRKPPCILHKMESAPYPNMLRELRKAAGLVQSDIAKLWGCDTPLVSRIERGTVGISREKLLALDDAYGWSPSMVYGKQSSNMVPVLGEVGAGGAISPIDDMPLINPLHLSEKDFAELNCEFVEAPPGTYPTNIACVVVRGNSMYPVYKDGEYLFYRRTPRDCSDSIGLDCVVALEDGRMMVKTVRRGSGYGTYTLDSYNQPPILDVRLKWCAPVEWTYKRI